MNTENTSELHMRVNPIPMTARVAVYLMSCANIANAADICTELGIDEKNVMPKDAALSGDVLLGNIMVVESKYRSMLSIIETAGADVVVDLPCGYTPKAIHLSELGAPFVGLDLPLVVTDANRVILPKVPQDDIVSFHSVDATNYASLREALSGVEGELCICTEGMMVYFNESEATVVVENICRLLEEHGGCWITPDPEISLHFLAAFQSLGPDAMKQLMSTRSAASESSDVPTITNSLLVDPLDREVSMARALAFLAEHHLMVERISLGKHMPSLAVYDQLADDQVLAFKKAMDDCCCWKMTLAQGTRHSFEFGRSFRCVYHMTGAGLSFELTGRLDTISSPELLSAFDNEQAKAPIRSVEIDCGNLDYVSSAGIRIFLMMHKGCPDGLRLINVPRGVREVLEQMGLYEMLT